MKLLTKQTDYAVRSAVYMARRSNGFVSSREIAEGERIPLHFLRRILQRLIQGGVAESKEGAGGGVRLKALPGKIRVADLIRLFQGDIRLSECMFRRKLCSNRSTCVLRKRIKGIEKMVAKAFEGITIGDLIHDLEETDETQCDTDR